MSSFWNDVKTNTRSKDRVERDGALDRSVFAVGGPCREGREKQRKKQQAQTHVDGAGSRTISQTQKVRFAAVEAVS